MESNDVTVPEVAGLADPAHENRVKFPRIRFDRNELAGSFGDIGTDLPLVIGMVFAAGLDAASVFIMFGLAQIATGLVYGLPMPMQPLKAMAVIVIGQKVSGDILFGGGLAIGVVMLLLVVSGGLTWLARIVPKCVVRGVQFGLGLSLASLALKDYVQSDGVSGYALAAVVFVVMLLLLGNRRVPGGLVVILLGIAYALVYRYDSLIFAASPSLALPKLYTPTWNDIATGFLVLALPQLPLSLSNSVIATNQTIKDLFPGRAVGVPKIGLTYAVANLIMPWFSGIPVCHGCGGLAGHYAFGARTGGAVIIYGGLYLVLGLFFSRQIGEVIQIFPKPILGIVLLFEAMTLLLFVRDQAAKQRDLMIAMLVALIAFTLPQGYVVGLLVGTAIYYLAERGWLLSSPSPPS
ncbi:MAG: putative sulfate/molybdate transporter [Bythopirellula sp.]|nr:putative sulfate/molybdate transporter [Bythopirellula sp.]